MRIVNYDLISGVARKYAIRKALAERLRTLRNFEIVIVCDDSGSMITTVDAAQRTRWDELRSIVKIILEIGVIFDTNGVDIYFINGRTFHNVKNPETVDQAFATRPSGYTPLASTLDKVFQSPLSRPGRDKKLLVFVATDGVPTDNDGNENVPELEYIMRQKRQTDTTYVAFLLCTDDPSCMSYLTNWGQTMGNVDVTYDFYTERSRIRKYQGNDYTFSFGDYVVKALIGAVDPAVNARYEPKKTN